MQAIHDIVIRLQKLSENSKIFLEKIEKNQFCGRDTLSRSPIYGAAYRTPGTVFQWPMRAVKNGVGTMWLSTSGSELRSYGDTNFRQMSTKLVLAEKNFGVQRIRTRFGTNAEGHNKEL